MSDPACKDLESLADLAAGCLRRRELTHMYLYVRDNIEREREREVVERRAAAVALEDFRRTLDSFRIAGYGGGHE
jgi:hypothetical protein